MIACARIDPNRGVALGRFLGRALRPLPSRREFLSQGTQGMAALLTPQGFAAADPLPRVAGGTGNRRHFLCAAILEATGRARASAP